MQDSECDHGWMTVLKNDRVGRFVRRGVVALSFGLFSLGVGSSGAFANEASLPQPTPTQSGSAWERFERLEANPEVRDLKALAGQIALFSGFTPELRTVMVAENGDSANRGHTIQQELTLPGGDNLTITLTTSKGNNVGESEVNRVQKRCMDHCGSVLGDGYGFWEVSPSEDSTTIVAMASDRPNEAISVVVSDSSASERTIGGARLIVEALSD